jgi:hypothetical protein
MPGTLAAEKKQSQAWGAAGALLTIPYPLSSIAFPLSYCLPRIRDRFCSSGRSLLCGECLAELLCCFGTLMTGFVYRSLSYGHIDHLAFDQSPSLESIHVSALALA